MVNHCCAYGCTNRASKGTKGNKLTFHLIPKEPIIRQAWVTAIKRKDWQPSGRTYVCSEHFKDEDFNRTSASGFVRLREGVIPSIFKRLSNNLQKKGKSPRKKLLEDDIELRNLDLPVEQKYKKKLEETFRQLLNARKRSKSLAQSNRRLKIRVLRYKAVLKEVTDKNSNKDNAHLKNLSTVTKEITKRVVKNKGQYSTDLRSFALTLKNISPRAYEFVRKNLKSALPHPRTLLKWHECINNSNCNIMTTKTANTKGFEAEHLINQQPVESDEYAFVNANEEILVQDINCMDNYNPIIDKTIVIDDQDAHYVAVIDHDYSKRPTGIFIPNALCTF